MLEEIIQSCCTGFGDCVTGYVSAYLFKKQIEKRYIHHEIRLSIAWLCVKCPYVKSEHLFHGPHRRRHMSNVNCLYSGIDGTQAFKDYFKSQRMLRDLNYSTQIKLIINQYVGKCFIDEGISREEIKQLTYDAYHYFWEHVLDQEKIHKITPSISLPIVDLTVVYVRVGDQYLCQKQPPSDALKECYQLLKDTLLNGPIALIGDVDNPSMNEAFHSLYDLETLKLASGSVSHSVGGSQMSLDEWAKVFADLALILSAKNVFILTNFSNFPRIVLFLKPFEQVVVFKDNQLRTITDTSTFFAKHYNF